MACKRNFAYALVLLIICCTVRGSQEDTCNAAGGVGSSMGDGSCDPQNLSSGCNWDGGDCSKCTCEHKDFVCGIDGYLCLDPNPVDDDLSTCEGNALPSCSVDDQTPVVMESTTQVLALAQRVNCSGGVFDVEWRGSIVVDTEILVSYGTVLNVTGVGSGAIIDGGGKTRLFRVVNASLQLNGVEIRNGSATFGGAIMAINSTLALHRTSFVGNTATDKSGGAMFLYRSSVSFSEQTGFFNNSANYGGALYAVSNSSASWEGVSNFTGNSASHSGGALGVVVGSTVSWASETTFEGNAALTYRGGALFLEGWSSASWSACANFIANNAKYEGGAIFVDGSNAFWRGGSLFSGNSVTFGGGGAILIGDSSTVSLNEETTFEFNTCASEGGAVSSRALDFSTSTSAGTHESSANNKCGSSGGAIAIGSALFLSFETNNVTFCGNEAGVSGGGVSISATDAGPSFTNATFLFNSAEVGGGAFITGDGPSINISEGQSSATFEGCRFMGNKAAATGGAIEIATGTVVITDVVFKKNKASVGGALRLSGITSIQGCTFEENLSDANGAPAISMIGYTLAMKNCTFSDNTYNCSVGTFLDETESEDRFSTVCSGCGECGTCTVERMQKVPTTCSEALEHSSSPGGHLVTFETLLIDPGYWRATKHSTTILACYHEDACAGGMTDSPEFCHEGYTGPYCSVCTGNYIMGPGFTCIKCSDNVWGVVAAVIVLVITVVVAILAVKYVMSIETGAGRGTISRLLHRVSFHSVKIVIVAWQILTQFATVVDVTYPGMYKRFLNAVDILNFDLTWMISAGCFVVVDFHGCLFMSTIGPIIVKLFLSGTYTFAVRKHLTSEEALIIVRHKHVSAILLVMFLVYSTVSSVLFQMFDCEVLDDGKNYFCADYTIECDAPRHRALMIYSGVMILLYPLGIPAFFAYLLFQNRKVLMDVTTREDSLSVRPISDLWKPYRPSRFYYVETIQALIVEDDSAAQIAVTLILAFVFTVISEGLAPYESETDAWVSRLGHAVVVSSMYYALLLKVDISDETHASQNAFDVVLVTIHVAMVLAVASEAVLTGCFFQTRRVEDPWPRSTRYRPERVRTASHSLCGTVLETRDSLDVD